MGNQNFDVEMRHLDGAECCDLVGLFILSKLQHLEEEIGLYRDEGESNCLTLYQQETEMCINMH